MKSLNKKLKVLLIFISILCICSINASADSLNDELEKKFDEFANKELEERKALEEAKKKEQEQQSKQANTNAKTTKKTEEDKKKDTKEEKKEKEEKDEEILSTEFDKTYKELNDELEEKIYKYMSKNDYIKLNLDLNSVDLSFSERMTRVLKNMDNADKKNMLIVLRDKDVDMYSYLFTLKNIKDKDMYVTVEEKNGKNILKTKFATGLFSLYNLNPQDIYIITQNNKSERKKVEDTATLSFRLEDEVINIEKDKDNEKVSNSKKFDSGNNKPKETKKLVIKKNLFSFILAGILLFILSMTTYLLIMQTKHNIFKFKD